MREVFGSLGTADTQIHFSYADPALAPSATDVFGILRIFREKGIIHKPEQVISIA